VDERRALAGAGLDDARDPRDVAQRRERPCGIGGVGERLDVRTGVDAGEDRDAGGAQGALACIARQLASASSPTLAKSRAIKASRRRAWSRGAWSSHACAYGLRAIVARMPSVDPTSLAASVATHTRTTSGR
jgi:hypothetical protein